MYYFYVLECQDDFSWYIGYSEDLQQRIKDHLSGQGCRVGMPLDFDGYKLGSNRPGFSLPNMQVALFQKFDY